MLLIVVAACGPAAEVEPATTTPAAQAAVQLAQPTRVATIWLTATDTPIVGAVPTERSTARPTVTYQLNAAMTVTTGPPETEIALEPTLMLSQGAILSG